MTEQIDRSLDAASTESAVELLQAVAVGARLRILWALLHGEHSVNELATHVGANAAAVSQHLRHLRRLEMVTSRREGNFVYYSCDHPDVRAVATAAVSYGRSGVGTSLCDCNHAVGQVGA